MEYATTTSQSTLVYLHTHTHTHKHTHTHTHTQAHTHTHTHTYIYIYIYINIYIYIYTYIYIYLFIYLFICLYLSWGLFFCRLQVCKFTKKILRRVNFGKIFSEQFFQIIFALLIQRETNARKCSVKVCYEKICKLRRKTFMPTSGGI